MIADKSINLDTLHKVLFDNEKLELSEECIQKVEESGSSSNLVVLLLL